MDGWMDEWMDSWINVHVLRCVGWWIGGLMDKGINKRVDGWRDI